MKSVLTLTALLGISLSSVGMASPLSDWFARSSDQRGPIPAESLKTSLHSPSTIKQARQSIWDAYREGARQQGWDKAFPAQPGGMDTWLKDGKLEPAVADLGEKTMPYVLLAKGKKPASGWPMFICLHGGGCSPEAKGPHTWSVNTREWQAQMRLTTHVWPSDGLYLIPRMADDRDGRWYFGYNQVFFDRAIQQAILFNGVDSNRIYLMGISEGGYAAFSLGSMMADRWAGCCAMAAAESIDRAPPENLRHVALICSIGETDTMYDRIELARKYFKRYDELKQTSPDGFNHFFDEQRGRGHGIDYQPGPKWIADFARTPVPKTINWTVIKQHDRHRTRLYWLALDDYQGKLPLQLTATVRADNRIEITALLEQDGRTTEAKDLNLRVYLSDTLVDLTEEVSITVNGREVFKGRARPSMEALIRSTAERGDPEQVFPAQVKVKL